MSISLILAVIFYLYFGILFFLMNGVAFSGFFFILGTVCLIYHFIKDKIKKFRWLDMLIKFFIIIILIVFIVIEGMIISFPKNSIEDCDYIVVLGARVIGNEPGLTLKGRLDRAFDYIEKTDADCKIIVSGGKGGGENISEAEAMKRYFVKKGLNQNKIIKEDKSINTNENLRFSKEKIEKDSKKKISNLKIKIITTDFHAFRSDKYAKNIGYKNISFCTEKTRWYLIPVLYTREFFAVIKMFIISVI